MSSKRQAINLLWRFLVAIQGHYMQGMTHDQGHHHCPTGIHFYQEQASKMTVRLSCAVNRCLRCFGWPYPFQIISHSYKAKCLGLVCTHRGVILGVSANGIASICREHLEWWAIVKVGRGAFQLWKEKERKRKKKDQQSSEERKYDSKLVNTECFKGRDKYKFLNEGI